MNTTSRSGTGGFVSIEMMFALIVISVMTAMGINLASKWSDSQNYHAAPQQQQAVAEAASKYLKDNFTAVASASNAAPVQITVPMLRNAGYLATGFSEKNAFGQTFLALARRSGTNQLESIVITIGGETIDEIGTREIAENLGGAGGFVPVATPSIVQGTRGGWQVNLTNFGVNPGAGHTASALFLLDGTLANDYLYRNFIAGKPELNRMNTDLDMGANNVINANNVTGAGQVEGGTLKSKGRTEVGEYIDIKSEEVEGTACEKTGLVSKTDKGLILSCQSGIWTAARGNPYGGSFMFSLNSADCAAPNPLTGSCDCPKGYSANGTGWIGNGVSEGSYTAAQCRVDTRTISNYTIKRTISIYLSSGASRTIRSECELASGLTGNCSCPGNASGASGSADVTSYTNSNNQGIVDNRVERINFSCIVRN